MAGCIKKLDVDVLFDCANMVNIGGLGNVEELVLLNSEDVSNIAIAAGAATVTMKTGTKGYTVNSIKNSVQYTDGVKANDIIPNMEEHTVVIKLMSTNVTDAAAYAALRQKLLLGNFRAAFKSSLTGQYYLAGALAGLEASEMATDTAADGITSITIKTPDAAAGDTLAGLSKASYDKLKTVAA